MFSDYARNAVRMSALLPTHNIYVYTHDSIGLGEDGPTHQPVEHVASLRLIPGLEVWRPCDTTETAVAWKCAIEKAGNPSVLVLTRQGLPHQERSAEQVDGIARGGYVLKDCDGDPEAILIATGSEVGLAVEAAAALTAEGRRVRVVSMPCTNLFDAQDADYRESVLPANCRRRVAVEAGATDGWRRYVGDGGAVLGMHSFGLSAPATHRTQRAVIAMSSSGATVRASGYQDLHLRLVAILSERSPGLQDCAVDQPTNIAPWSRGWTSGRCGW